MNRCFKIVLCLLFGLIFVEFLNNENALAADRSTMMKKWAFTQYYNCAKNNFKKTTSRVHSDVYSDVFSSGGSMKMPSNGFQGSPSDPISCQSLFTDYAGIADADWNNQSASNALLTGLGYSPIADTGSVKVNYVRNDIIRVGDKEYVTPYDESVTISRKANGNGITTDKAFSLVKVKLIDGNRLEICYFGSCSSVPYSTDANVLSDNISKGIKMLAYENGNIEIKSTEVLANGYKFAADGNVYATAQKSIRNYSGMSMSDLVYSNSELYTLYLHYLTSNGKIGCGEGSTAGTKVKLKTTDGSFKECRVDFGDNNPGSISVNTQSSTTYYGTKYPVITTTNMNSVINWLNSVDESTLTDIEDSLVPPDGVIEVAEDTEEQGEASEMAGDECYNAGVEGMSWILCPAINNMTSTIDAIDTALNDMLAVDKNLYDNNSASRNAWTYFRDIANVLMVIVLIVIIFSQLTGYGIDNYGIKKMLPKLIIMAVLVNFSFIACQLAVDASNIIGSSASSMLERIGNELYGGYTVGEFTAQVVASLFAIVGGVGAASGTIISIASIAASGTIGPMVVISLVLTLLVALVAIMFFFIMLGARMIIIIVLMAISPLAFACYILPNTQSLFKKWWSVFKAAILIYPICGILYGLSFVIRGMIFQGGEVHFMMALIAVMAPFLPFFALPSLLRGALNAVGNIGGALTAVSGGLRRGIGGANQSVRNSQAYKNETELQRRGMTRWQAGIGRDGKPIDVNKMSRLRRFASGGESGIAKARAQYAKDIETQGVEQSMLGTGAMAAIAGAESKVDERRVADAQALIESGTEVNSNDVVAMNRFHAQALRDFHNATTDAERNTAMARVQAAQNIMAKTDKGRAGIQTNFENALRNNEARGVSQAASHMMSNFGAQVKNVNRGEFGLISDLSTAKTDAVGNIDSADYQKVLTNMNTDVYNAAGTDKYTPESLANADEMALDRLYDSMGSMTNEQRRNIKETARSAIKKARTTNLNVKPEVMAKLENIDKWRAP